MLALELEPTQTRRPSDGVWTTTMFVTPEMAREWIAAGYDDDVKLKPGLVAQYAQDMKDGLWQLTHQGMAFDASGRRIDGQNRLHAIIASGVDGILTRVTFGMPKETREVLDGGRTRTIPEMACDPWMTRKVATIAKRLLLGARSEDKALSKPTVIQFARAHKDAILFADDRDTGPIRKSAYRAAVAAAWYHEDRSVLAQLLASVVRGYDADPRRSATVVALTRRMTEPASGGGVRMADDYLRAQRAIKAYVNREPLGRMRPQQRPIYEVP
jgi:hypothetical protein